MKIRIILVISFNPLWADFADQKLILIVCNLLNRFLFSETSFVAIWHWLYNPFLKFIMQQHFFYADSLLLLQLEQKVCNFLIKIGHHDMGTVIKPTKYNKEVRWGVSILKMLHNGLESFFSIFKVLLREI